MRLNHEQQRIVNAMRAGWKLAVHGEGNIGSRTWWMLTRGVDRSVLDDDVCESLVQNDVIECDEFGYRLAGTQPDAPEWQPPIGDMD